MASFLFAQCRRNRKADALIIIRKIYTVWYRKAYIWKTSVAMRK